MLFIDNDFDINILEDVNVDSRKYDEFIVIGLVIPDIYIDILVDYCLDINIVNILLLVL